MFLFMNEGGENITDNVCNKIGWFANVVTSYRLYFNKNDGTTADHEGMIITYISLDYRELHAFIR
jgi:hypothetical protein